MADELAPPVEVLHLRQSYDDPQDDEQWDRWRTTRQLTVDVGGRHLEVPYGFDTDLVSVPGAFAWFIPRAGRYARAAVLHDHLWQQIDDGDTESGDRRQADETFLLAMQAAGVTLLRRRIMWTAVRANAIFCKRQGGAGSWKDLLPMLVWALVALAVAGVPAVLILVFSVVLWLVESAIALAVPHETPRGPQFKT
ncbi:DUF1353 domain-containing protein [Mycobacterium deserti]|uniref:DUF1353 domain-containing protein n=1 Tax=Mycobacterium deserti TaxID=2978347 RepID=A0ABT2M5T7_9MYCO|nr:DUF1353 domain-containing protein [Mycobacterium deserti]MCT7656994.1 DUF1353 domain-containing protein [Mycobacterium deserti]